MISPVDKVKYMNLYIKGIVGGGVFDKLINTLDSNTLMLLDKELKKVDAAVDNNRIKVTEKQMENLNLYFPLYSLKALANYLVAYGRVTKSSLLVKIGNLLKK